MYALCISIAVLIVILCGVYHVWRTDFANRRKTQYDAPPKRRNATESADNTEDSQDIHKPGRKDMDSLYIGFFDFVFYLLLIIPSQQFVFWREFVSLNLRRFIHSNVKSLRGTRFLKHWDPKVIGGRMLLETSEMIYLVHIRTSEDGCITGHYEWTDFMYVTNTGELKKADRVTMEIDLQTKLLVAAHLDDQELSACEAVQLLAMHVATVMHPVLHTYSNWGIDVHHPDPFVRRMGKVTIIYNYLGSTWFPRSTLPFLTRWGYLFEPSHQSAGQVADNMKQILHSEWLKGLPSHHACAQLVPYSTLARFITKLCKSFGEIFDKYGEEFEEIERDAMFTGTVLHSLDHTMFTKVLEDPMWLFLDDTEFSASGKIAAFANACLSRDLPGLLFDKRFKDASHPFYKEVYEEAKLINPELADLIDTCIIK